MQKWWKERVAYQIYPKSFLDTNGDGVGDLQGIIQKLDYLKELGIGILWISPIYLSPMKDNGYDIADYYAIDPMFGTMEDMEELLAEAKKRDIYVLMDLVVNHCSSEHEWFRKALQDPKGPYGKYFIIREGKNGNPPTNWRSIFEGSVWEPIPDTPYYYYHTFAKEQPDLNWENPALRREIYDMMNFWLEKGLGGFRVDAITYIKKDPNFPQLPVDGEDGLASLSAAAENYPGIEVFLKEMRQETFDRYHAFSVAEMANVTPEKLKEYIGAEDGLFSSIFDFSYQDLDVQDVWYRANPITAQRIKKPLYISQRMAQEADGVLMTILESHDQPRVLNKWIPEADIGYESAAMLATFNLLLRGIPLVYQGEEIGMTNRKAGSIAEYDDLCTHAQYERALQEGYSPEEALAAMNRRSRDHGRTPMQWSDVPYGGFSQVRPWFPVNENYHEINVKAQEQEGSLLSYYRKLIKLRTQGEWSRVLTEGSFEPLLAEEKDVIAYRRILADREVRVVLNFTAEEKEIPEKAAAGEYLAGNYPFASKAASGSRIRLRAYEAIVTGSRLRAAKE